MQSKMPQKEDDENPMQAIIRGKVPLARYLQTKHFIFQNLECSYSRQKYMYSLDYPPCLLSKAIIQMKTQIVYLREYRSNPNTHGTVFVQNVHV